MTDFCEMMSRYNQLLNKDLQRELHETAKEDEKDPEAGLLHVEGCTCASVHGPVRPRVA